MSRSVFVVSAIVLFTALPEVFAQTAKPAYTVFDTNGSCGSPPALRTFPVSINDQGEIAGNELTSHCNPHGFVRDGRGGKLTYFDAPIMQTGCPFTGFTQIRAINADGEIVGTNDACVNGSTRGFIRDSQGVITSIDPPAGIKSAAASDINAKGEVAGYYSGVTNPGFLRRKDGTVTIFDPPAGAVAVVPVGINNDGEITGYSVLPGTFAHRGFVRDANGRLTSFDATTDSTSTQPAGINAKGDVTGFYTDSHGTHGFLLDANGHLIAFDVSGSTAGTTKPSGINKHSEIVGIYSDSKGNHGFLRTVKGGFIPLDVPGAPASGNCEVGPCGTNPVHINDRGEIVGNFNDATGAHGFVRAPEPGGQGIGDN